MKRRVTSRILSKVDIGPAFFIFTLILFVAMITVITLVYSTDQVTKGYMLNSLDQEHQELVREQEIMDMKISDVRSLKFIEGSGKVAAMVNPPAVLYVSGETAIASID